MAVPGLNNVATNDVYTDDLTVLFTYPRPGFTLIVYNASAYYQLAFSGSGGLARDIQFEPGEHLFTPSILSFRSTIMEGLPPNSLFAGIRLRSGAVGVPARVTVA